MGVGLNWGETNKALRQGSGNQSNARRFVIKDGETVPVRFLGGEDEPFIWKRHYVKKGKGGTYFVCAEDAQKDGKHEGCVGCFIAKAQGKGGTMKLGARVYTFSLLDPRKYHKLESEVTVRDPETGDKYETRYPPCRGENCKWCDRDNKAIAQGVRHWTIPGQVTEALRDFALKTVGRKCAKCQTGKISVIKYVCPDCETAMEVDDPNEEQKCFECSGKKAHMVLPKAILKCSKECAKPRRVTLADVWVEITRSGTKTNTSYNFSVGDIEPIPDEYENPQPIDFSKEDEFKPLSPAGQAALIGVKNPFKGEDDDDDDGDDDVPRKKKKKNRSSLLDDDSDDDDDEDPYS